MIRVVSFHSTEITTELLNMLIQAKRFTTKYYVTLSVTTIKWYILVKVRV